MGFLGSLRIKIPLFSCVLSCTIGLCSPYVAEAHMDIRVDSGICYTSMDAATFQEVKQTYNFYSDRLTQTINNYVLPRLAGMGALSQESINTFNARPFSTRVSLVSTSAKGNITYWEKQGKHWTKNTPRAAQDYDKTGQLLQDFSDDLVRLDALLYIISIFYSDSSSPVSPHRINQALNSDFLAAYKDYMDFNWHIVRASAIECLTVLGGDVSAVDSDSMPDRVDPRQPLSPPRVSNSSWIEVRFKNFSFHGSS